MTKNWDKKKHKCKCSGTGCGQHRTRPMLSEITLNVKNLHLYFDEHMNSIRFYHNGSDMCTCECGEKDCVEVDLQVLTERIDRNNGVILETVDKALVAACIYLIGFDACKTAGKSRGHDRTQSGNNIQENYTKSVDKITTKLLALVLVAVFKILDKKIPFQWAIVLASVIMLLMEGILSLWTARKT